MHRFFASELDRVLRQMKEISAQMVDTVERINASLKTDIAEIHDILDFPYKRSAE
jgi:energy-converting hydrogenase A subunit M